MSSKFVSAIFQVPRLRITFAMKTILKKLVDKRLVRYKKGKFYPTSYKAVLQHDIAYIVNYLNVVFSNLSNYYGFAHN